MISPPQVGIVDYHAGNLRSIVNALEHVDASPIMVRESADLQRCTHLILPGVGAFGFCAERLRESGMVPALEQWIFVDRRPLLGICVGMQLLATASEESPEIPGLNWLGGSVELLQSRIPDVRVPHVGWNTVTFAHAWGDFPPGTAVDFYFDHSFAYHEPRRGRTLAEAMHGVTFAAMVGFENIVGVQFHPEKSQTSGLRLLRGFLNTCA